MAATEAFGTANFVVMALFLVATLSIGLFYGLRKKNARDLLMAHDMSVAPVSLSMMATFLSAILIVGTPAEIFYFGLEWVVVVITFPIAAAFSSLVFLPIFFPLKLTSVYQYLGLRYNTSVMTVVGTLGFMTQNLLYTSIALYAPSIVLSNVTGLPSWLSICLVGFVGTSYTAFGGFRAVVWADVLQAAIMVGGVLSIIIQGCVVVGGFSEMLAINREHGRLTLATWDVNPLQRHNFWNIFFGQVCMWTSLLSVNQPAAQRLFSLPTYKKAAITSLIGGVLMLVMSTLSVLSGLAIFATFATCDPLAAGITRRRDELVPHFVLTHLNHVPGLGGLFIACVLSGALSTISSSLNSLATVTWQDFCLPCVCTGRLSPTSQQWIIRIIGVMYGCVAVALAFLAKNMGGVLQVAIGVYGGCAGPLLAVFCLAIFTPFSNPIGVTVGMVVGLALTLWASFGASFGGVSPPATLPTSVAGCLSNVTTAIAAASEMPDHNTPDKSPLETFYSISYMLYAVFGFLITTITGIVVSVLTGGSRIDVDPDHLSPIIKCFAPKKKYRLSEGNGTPNDAFEMDQTGKTT